MRKLLLMGVAAMVSAGSALAQAQMTKQVADPLATPYTGGAGPAVEGKRSFNVNGLIKTTATPFYTETFAGGTNTTIPNGWTAVGNANFPATWKWRNVRTTSVFSLDTIRSTTSTNGWMIFDSDSIGETGTVAPLEGSLISPVINCSGRSSVALTFQQWFRRFADSCYVDVSTNNFNTFTRYPLTENNTLADNSSLATGNPTTTLVDISAVAANQANVKIRFYYLLPVSTSARGGGPGIGGSYNWYVDDIAVAELDPNDVRIGKSLVVAKGDTASQFGGYMTFSRYPRQLVDTIWALPTASNLGSNGQNIPIAASFYHNGSVVFTQTRNQPLPYGARDTLVDYTLQQGFVATDTGSYLVAINAPLTGDASPANNRDSVGFAISDTLIMVQKGMTPTGTYYVHRPGNGSSLTEQSYYVGSHFQIPASKRDTFTGASVMFSRSTKPNTRVRVELYQRNGTSGYRFIATTKEKTLTANDITTVSGNVTNYVYANFDADVSGGISKLIIGAGTYALVVKGISVPATDTVLVLTSPALTYYPGLTGYGGAIDTSLNNSSFAFAPSKISVGYLPTPYVRPHFSTLRSTTTPPPPGPGSVNDVAVALAGEAYPNPANTELTVPFAVGAAAEVTVSLSNPMGQVIASQSLGRHTAGQNGKAVFNTAALSSGIYFYTVEAAGKRATGRVVVSH